MIQTGSIGLDIALGGGWEPGTMNEIWGGPGSGKTVLALHATESVVRSHREVVWIDTVKGVEHMDRAPRVIVGRPRNAEQAFMIAYHACYEPTVALVVVDSANNLVRQRELDGDPDYVPHPQREYRVELSELKIAAEVTDTVVLFVSQPRDKERQPIRGTGISEKVKYRIHLHADVVHQDDTRDIVAHIKHVPLKKTRYDAAKFTVRPGQGIDRARELVVVGIEQEIVTKTGSWLRFGDLRAHGVDELASKLRYYPLKFDELYRELAP